MSWLYFVAAAWIALGALVNVGQVGKPREPITGGVAAVTVIFCAAIIALLVIAGINH